MNQANTERYHQTRKATLVGAIANIILAVAKVLFGWLGHSSALVADGIHSFSDLLTDLLVILAAKFAHQGADDDHPYGHDRIETAATVALAMILIITGLAIIYNPVLELFHHQIDRVPDTYVLWIAIFSVIVNEIIYRYTLSVAKKIKSDILHANALHSRSDAASSFVVLIGVAGSILGLTWLDQVAAIIVGVMIVKMGVSIGWKNISELIDTGVDEVTLDKIRAQIIAVPGVCALHELRTRMMAGKIVLDVHIIVDNKISVSEGHHIGDQVLKALYGNIEQIRDVTVHVDSEDDELYSQNASLPRRQQLQAMLQRAWQGLPGAEQDLNLQIHYLQGRIEVEVILPLSILASTDEAKSLQQQYRDACSQFSDITQVTLLFR